MQKLERLMLQATSGRWLLTVAAGMCLLFMTIADCWWVLAGKFSTGNPMPFSVEALLSIITAVFMAYFGKARESNNSNTNSNKQ